MFRFRRTFSITDQDINLSDYIIKNEMSGVLNILLDGLRRVRKRGQFDSPPACLEARQAWYSSNNMILDYIKSRLTQTANGVLKSFSLIWADYLDFCMVNGIKRPLTRGGFRYSLDSAGVTIEETKKGVFVCGWKLRKTAEK